MKKLDDNPTLVNVLMAMGFLTEGALLESMVRSKTLTVMVVVGVALIGLLSYFLFFL